VFVDVDVPHEASVEGLEPVRALGQPGVALRVVVNGAMARSTSMAPANSGIGMPASFLQVPVPSPTSSNLRASPTMEIPSSRTRQAASQPIRVAHREHRAGLRDAEQRELGDDPIVVLAEDNVFDAGTCPVPPPHHPGRGHCAPP
jgi:hypothetical protein